VYALSLSSLEDSALFMWAAAAPALKVLVGVGLMMMIADFFIGNRGGGGSSSSGGQPLGRGRRYTPSGRSSASTSPTAEESGGGERDV